MIGGSVGLEYSKENKDSEEYQTNYGEKYGIKESSGSTTNSGSTNTGKNTTTNSGSVNTSSTKTDASVNTSTVGPSFEVTQNSGRVDTSQLMLTESAVDHLVKGMLESNSGLAVVSSGSKAAGGYNSTAQTQLTNDLTSRIAGEVAARSAVTKNVIGSSSSTQFNSGATTTQNIGATNSNTTQNIGASTSVTDVEQIIGASSSTTKSTDEMAEAALGNAEIIKSEDTEKTTAKTEMKMGWIVCTELVRQGRMPKKFYIPGLRAFNKYSPAIHKGYYFWAVPAVAHLKANPNSKLSKFLEVMLNARAEYLAAEATVAGARKTVLGWVAKQLVWGCWLLGKTVARDQPCMQIEGIGGA